MDRTTKAQLAAELAKAALAAWATLATGGFVPAAAAGTSLLSPLLDRLVAKWSGSDDFVAAAKTEILALAADFDIDDAEAQRQFAVARNVLLDYGLGPREFAELGLDPQRAAGEIARRSKAHELKDEEGLPRRALILLYERLLAQRDRQPELELAFKQQALAQLVDLSGLGAELRALAEQLAAPSLLRIPIEPVAYLPGVLSPSILLRAGMRVVDYVRRPADEAELDTWLGRDAPVGVRLYQGGGGSGKTRFALELCERLERRGWRAGFFVDRPDVPQGLDERLYARLFETDRKLLVVVDYAETRGKQLEPLLAAAAQGARPGRHIRLLLLARRESPAWWRELRESAPPLARALLSGPPTEPEARNLAALAPQIADRRSQFRSALVAFANATKQEPPEGEPPDLSAAPFCDPLYIQIAALSRLEGGAVPVTAEALLNEALSHERDYWRQWLGTRRDRDGMLNAAGQALAVITLWAGCRAEELARIQAEWPPRSDLQAAATPDLFKLLRHFYPAGEDIAPLLPDRLGEALVARALAGEHRGSLLACVFGRLAGPEQVVNAFNGLGRITGWHEELRWLQADFGIDIEDLAQDLRELFRSQPAAGQAPFLIDHMPWQTVALRELAADVTVSAYEALKDAEAEIASAKEKLSRLANDLACRLSALGRREAALAAAQDAAELYRELAAQRPDAFRPDLAMSLNNLASFLSALGRREAALAAAQDAAEL
ncbi:MAG: hypothetical protein U9Q81_04820, partial [Pseudomonadota bacterium]|nr:hypothetical protein [Pseudomonadota bacterium]